MNNKIRRSVAKLLLVVLSIGVLESHAQNDVQQSLAAKKVKVTLNKKKLTLKKGKTYKLKAKKTPAKAKLSWKSSKPKTVSVNSKGKIKAKKVGKATITVTAKYKGKKKKAICRVTVKGNKTPEVTPDNSVTQTPTPTPPTDGATDKNAASYEKTIDADTDTGED